MTGMFLLLGVKSALGAGEGETAERLPEDCRECAGGVGGRTPILFEACFKVRGLDVSELVTEDVPVSITRARGPGRFVE